jgi:hypothetical protein
MIPLLKPPATNCLILKHDEFVSSFAFKFNLRCYSTVCRRVQLLHYLGGAVQADSIKTRVESTPGFSA